MAPIFISGLKRGDVYVFGGVFFVCSALPVRLFFFFVAMEIGFHLTCYWKNSLCTYIYPSCSLQPEEVKLRAGVWKRKSVAGDL